MKQQLISIKQMNKQHNKKGQLVSSLDLSAADLNRPEWMDSPYRQKTQNIQQQQVVTPKNNPVLDMLEMELESSKFKLKDFVIEDVKDHLIRVQDVVYNGQITGNQEEYLMKIQKMNSPKNKHLIEEVSKTIQETQKKVQNNIKKKNYQISKKKIPRSKQQLKQFQKIDTYRMLKIKEGQVKNKVSDLHREMQDEYYQNKLRTIVNVNDIVQKNYYSIDHPRTNQAQSFVRDIQSKRRQEKMQLKDYVSYQQEQKSRMKEYELQKKQWERMERKTKLQQYYQSKVQEKMKGRQIQKRKKEEFKEWIQQYKRQVPLEIEKQEQYRMKVLIPQLEQKHKKLMTIKALHRPIDSEQIAQHQFKYSQFKKDDRIRKRAQLEMVDEQNQMHQQQLNQKLFKGKYRYIALEKMLEEKYPVDSRDIQQSKKNRIKAYSQHIRSSQQQKHQFLKESQIEAQVLSNRKFMRRVRNMDGSHTISHKGNSVMIENDKDIKSEAHGRKHSADIDTYGEGIKNLHFLKGMIREQKYKQIQLPPKMQYIGERIIEPKKRNILKEVRQKRQVKKQLAKDIKNSIKKSTAQDDDGLRALKAKADFLDERVRRKETKMKNISLEDKIKQGRQAQDQNEMVNAVLAKLEVINKVD